jgi:hypothetical protein
MTGTDFFKANPPKYPQSTEDRADLVKTGSSFIRGRRLAAAIAVSCREPFDQALVGTPVVGISVVTLLAASAE